MPFTRILSTSMPLARAKVGLAPTAVMAMPVLERKYRCTIRQQPSTNRMIPVGMYRLPMLKPRKSLSR